VSEAVSIGEKLRAARERRGLEVVQVAERLHVDTAIINSLESGQFGSLGAPVYVRGHLRRYAELLGEPDAPLQAQYSALEESSLAPDLTSTRRILTQPTRSSTARWPLIVIAVVLVLGVMVWWAMRAGPK
jgi:cytoskeleton protein RodZ